MRSNTDFQVGDAQYLEMDHYTRFEDETEEGDKRKVRL